jgi:hypothetical protein
MLEIYEHIDAITENESNMYYSFKYITVTCTTIKILFVCFHVSVRNYVTYSGQHVFIYLSGKILALLYRRNRQQTRKRTYMQTNIHATLLSHHSCSAARPQAPQQERMQCATPLSELIFSTKLCMNACTDCACVAYYWRLRTCASWLVMKHSAHPTFGIV